MNTMQPYVPGKRQPAHMPKGKISRWTELKIWWREIDRVRRLRDVEIPASFDPARVPGLSREVVEQLERDLHITSGKTTPDLKFTVEEVNCVGACALGPLVIIDGDYHGNMTSDRLSKRIQKLRKGDG